MSSTTVPPKGLCGSFAWPWANPALTNAAALKTTAAEMRTSLNVKRPLSGPVAEA